ncbi:MAG: LEPR-XLL domain-containing protein [Phycisphaerae bacterium]
MSRDRQVLLAGPVRKAVESLEQRVLMSASAGLVNGTLRIEGTNHADVIVVNYQPGGTSVLEVAVNGETSAFTARKVKRIEIEAGRGDDAITLNELHGKIYKGATVHAGRGNDTVVGGSGDDVLNLGAGDDEAAETGGADAIRGGGGTDLYNGAKFTTDIEDTRQARAAAGPAKPAPITIPTYTVSDLGILPGGAGNRGANNITDGTPGVSQHSLVGFSIVNDIGNQKVPHGMYKPLGTGAQRDIGTLGGSTAGSTSIAYDINDDNIIVGESRTVPNGTRHGFFYTTFMRDVGSLGGFGGDTVAWGLNDFNMPVPGPTIVGESNGTAFYKRGPGGALQTAPSVNGQGILRGRFREVNNYDRNIPPDGIGDIMVGYDSTNTQAVVYDEAADTTVDLGTIRGATVSEAFDVNSAPSGDYTVVGVSGEGTTVESAFWWRPSTGLMTALPTTPGDFSKAFGVNEPNAVTDALSAPGQVEIVGRIQRRNNNQIINRAVMWMEDGPASDNFVLIDLQALTSGGTGRVLTEAHAITTDGWIVAVGTVPTDAFIHAFLLRPAVTNTNGNIAKFSGTFIKPLFLASPTTPKIVFNFFGNGDYTVNKNNVILDLQTVDLARGQLPSEGVLNFTMPVGGLTRVVTNASKGIGKFSGKAELTATLSDGTLSTMLVSIEGTTSRSRKRDIISGNIIAVSSRGRALKQGNQFIMFGNFETR